ncbi:MAG TPA: FkbM family methyltransferase [Polyangiaceae bacterium]|nr:FkbM family methyltransferase [Polyangiaceae bacterium]
MAVRKLGFELVRAKDLENHALSCHLARLLRELEIECVLDVGANRGQYRTFLRRNVGFDRWIISFEPVSRNVSRLQQQAADDPRWVIQGYALGSEDGRMDLNVMKPDFLSSFRQPHSSVVPLYERLGGKLDHVESVVVRRLDSVIDDLRRRHGADNLFLKLDTQGFDLEVIRGAPRTLRSVRALQTELSVRPIYENAPPYQKMLDALTERGFSITAVCPVGRDDRMRVIELDCVLINDGGKT